MNDKRIVYTDPGLLSPEQLLENAGGRRRSLEYIIARHSNKKKKTFSDYALEWKEAGTWFLDHARVKISYDDFMMIVTIYALFGDDLRILVFPPSTDHVFVVMNTITFILFVLEMFLNTWIKSDFSRGVHHWKGYVFSFFFWLDLLALISMLPDLPWVSSFQGFSMDKIAGRAGKIGAKTGRVVRMVRLVRLVKLYKFTSQKRREKKMHQELMHLVENGHVKGDEIEAYVSKFTTNKQSKVGAELSDIITRRVIIAVLLMLCVVPLLSYSSSDENELDSTLFLQNINVDVGHGSSINCDYLLNSTNTYKEFMKSASEDYTIIATQPYLIGLDIQPRRCSELISISFYMESISENLRSSSIRTIRTHSIFLNETEYFVEAIFNLSSFLEESALSTIYLTMFVIFMLVTLSAQFIGDSERLVLAPIESMMQMVHMVASDPLEDFDFTAMALTSEYETRVVQTAIQKITALLRVGFGVAGAEIISSNMAVEGEGSTVLEPMIPGKRIYAIFGFCDIHSFDHCTEVLEDEIMLFVNSVASVVHQEVTRWGGLCNKNLGNAWLMVWRIGDQTALQILSGGRSCNNSFASRRKSLSSKQGTISNQRTISVDLRRIPGLDVMADKALIGFLKVVVEINRNPRILSYRYDPRLTKKEGYFNLSMGFGMHVGWAIEGAVGSLQKVDATYLSPHVNMAARMEAASKQFGVTVLMTDRFYELMSMDAQSFCRKIDVVTVKGSSVSTSIYTYDTLLNQKFPQLSTPKFTNLDLAEVLKQQAQDYDTSAWENDGDLVQLRKLVTPKFRAIFNEGLNSYLNGKWQISREKLLEADKLMADSDIGGDGPSRTILNYMEVRDWVCPNDWKGYRPLTNK